MKSLPKRLLMTLVAALLLCPYLWGEAAKALDTDVYTPESDVPLPCVVICPGRGYHKDLPLVKDLASRLKEEGFATLSFNWSFFTAKTQPSQDGSAELADIDAAIEMAKGIPGVDSSRIYLVGKSLGSVYGYHAFQKHPELKACLLYTPVIPEPDLGSVYYPDLKDESRPVAFILGNKDQDNCPLGNLYAYLGEITKDIPVVVLSGGHSFEESDDYTAPINVYNTKLAIEMGVYWLKRM